MNKRYELLNVSNWCNLRFNDKEDLNFKKRSIAYMIRPQYRKLTRVVNLWSLPLALVVGVLDLLQKKYDNLERKKKVICTLLIARLTNLGLPFTHVLRVGNGRGSPLTIFFIIPVLRLKKRIKYQNEKAI